MIRRYKILSVKDIRIMLPNFHPDKVIRIYLDHFTTVHSVYTFIKENYLVATQNDLDIPSNNLYNEYKQWFKEHVGNHKKPSTIQEFSKKMQEIGLTARQVRKNGTRKMLYQASREEIYNT